MKKRVLILHAALPITWLVIVLLASYLYKNSYGGIIRNSIMSLTACFIFLATYEHAVSNKELFWDNLLHPMKTYLWCSLGMLVAVLFPLLPVTGWIYPLIFLLSSFTTGVLPGILLGSSYLMVSVMLANASYGIFALYFLSGIMSIMLFSDFGRAFSSVVPIISNTLVQVVTSALLILFYLTGPITWESFLIPSINLFLCMILSIAMVRYYNLYYVDKEKNMYLAINDQTFPLLEQLRKENANEYMKAIHRSHFTQLIADELQLNPYLCKGGGYYCNIKAFREEQSDAATEEIMMQNHFPEALRDFIIKLNQRKRTDCFETKEELTVVLSGEIIDMIFEKKKRKESWADFEEQVLNIMNFYYENHSLQKLSLSFAEYEKIKNIFSNEKKYIKII